MEKKKGKNVENKNASRKIKWNKFEKKGQFTRTQNADSEKERERGRKMRETKSD